MTKKKVKRSRERAGPTIAGFSTVVYFNDVDRPGWARGSQVLASLYVMDAEAHEGGRRYPRACCWITYDGEVDFIWVTDNLRRQGYASALLDACDAEWEGCLYVDNPISEAAEAMIAAFERRRASRGGG